MTVPIWVQDAIFYQIFPDRFFNGIPNAKSPYLQAWGSEPTTNGFMGGDLNGIIQKFDYLLDLGINAIYLNPIFSSAANHRYHTNDYYKIDSTLGSLADFKVLIDVAHSNNVKVILDGVFNHTGRGFFAFNDILENGPQSRFIDWYHVNNFPLNAFSGGQAENYQAWWNLKDLPKLNTSTPAVRKYLMGVARYWIEQGADGWRLDVPSEIDDDGFWEEFRTVVKMANPDAYIFGEIWTSDPRWVGGKHFDGLMHYPFREAVLMLLNGQLSLIEFADRIENFLTLYPRENIFGMYLSLGSHDTRRLMNKLDGSIDKLKLAYLIQFAYPGAPAIYYGDEIGLDGGKDPQNRKAFPWAEEEWNNDLRKYIQRLISVRKMRPALRRGEFKRIYLEEAGDVYAFARIFDDESVLIAINTSETTHRATVSVDQLDWQNGQIIKDLLSQEKYGITERSILVNLPPWSGIVLAKA